MPSGAVTLSQHSVLLFIQGLLTDSLFKFFHWDEAALLAVEDGVAQLDEAVSLGDPLEVAGRYVFEGADDRPGDVGQTVSEVRLVQERDGAGVRLRLSLRPLVAGPALGVGGYAGDLVTVDGGVWTVNCIRVVPARLDVQYLYLWIITVEILW